MSEPIVTKRQLETARANVSPHAYRTAMLTSHLLSMQTGFDVRLKAEVFQRGGSFKFRGALNKFATLSEDQKRRGVICSSSGNHAQGVAIAAKLYGIRAVVVMAENATPSKVEATLGYGAEVVQHGQIWDEANEKALSLVESEGLTYVHPFDDTAVIAGQGTLGIEILEDFPEVDLIIVPIGGGGLIAGVASAVKAFRPDVRVIGVESSGGAAMRASLDAGHVVTLDHVNTIIDGIRARRVCETTFEIVQSLVSDVLVVPDDSIFESMLWIMAHCKVVVEGAGAASVAVLQSGLVDAERGSHIACVLSGGNLDFKHVQGEKWN
jgi:threonine dehydratase